MSEPLQYPYFVRSRIKAGDEVLRTMTGHKANIWHLGTGVSGEAGELLDAIKKYVVYNKPLDEANVIEEMGDIEFYLEGLRQALGLSRDEILRANREKLTKRYKDGYSDKAAHERADKHEV